MEHIMIKCDGVNNYGSMDMSPECKPRPLNDTPSIGNYLIIARVFVLGPHWPLFMCTMIGFDVFAYYMLKQEQEMGKDIHFGMAIAIIQTICYLGVGLTNPGISNDCSLNQQYYGQLYTLSNRSNAKNAWYCEKCQKIQPAKSDHCIFCKVCVQNFDHHCPWTGKCIGGGNILQFWAFILSTIVFFTYFINLMLSQREANKQK